MRETNSRRFVSGDHAEGRVICGWCLDRQHNDCLNNRNNKHGLTCTCKEGKCALRS